MSTNDFVKFLEATGEPYVRQEDEPLGRNPAVRNGGQIWKCHGCGRRMSAWKKKCSYCQADRPGAP